MDRAHACFCIGPQNGEKYCPCIMRQKQEEKWPKLTPETKLSPDVAKFLEDRRKYFEATKDLDVGKFLMTTLARSDT